MKCFLGFSNEQKPGKVIMSVSPILDSEKKKEDRIHLTFLKSQDIVRVSSSHKRLSLPVEMFVHSN